LVIFVTPTLAKPIRPQDVQLPTDGQVDPSNIDFFLKGRMEGTPPPADAASAVPPGK
jgi:pilus assembly protein CpaC